MLNYVVEKSKIKTLKNLLIYDKYISNKLCDYGYEYFKELDLIIQQGIKSSVVYVYYENKLVIFSVTNNGTKLNILSSWSYSEYINMFGRNLSALIKIKCKLRRSTC